MNNPPPLRPLRLGQLLDQAIYLYRHHFWTFVGIAAVVQIPHAVLDLLLALGNRPYTFSLRYAIVNLLSTGLAFLAISIRAAAISQAAAAYQLGQPLTIGDTYGAIANHWLRLAGVLLLTLALGAFPILLFSITVSFAISVSLSAAPFWTPLFAITTGLFTLCSTILAPLSASIAILEEQTVWRSIRRAWDLVRQRFWTTIGLAVLLFAIQQLVSQGTSALAQWLFGVLVNPLDPAAYTLWTTIHTLTGLILSLLCFPLASIALTMLYLDARVRTEGLDLNLRVETQTADRDPLKSLKRYAPLPSQGPIVTAREIGRFLLLFAALAAIGLGLAAIGPGLAGLDIGNIVGF